MIIYQPVGAFLGKEPFEIHVFPALDDCADVPCAGDGIPDQNAFAAATMHRNKTLSSPFSFEVFYYAEFLENKWRCNMSITVQ